MESLFTKIRLSFLEVLENLDKKEAFLMIFRPLIFPHKNGILCKLELSTWSLDLTLVGVELIKCYLFSEDKVVRKSHLIIILFMTWINKYGSTKEL